jgi:Flp pilus assembly pilin Flp
MTNYITWLGSASSLRGLARDRRGQDLIEYALLGAFIAVVVAAFFPTMIGPNISTILSKVSSQLAAAPAG